MMLWETVTSLFEKCERALEMSKDFSTFWRLLDISFGRC